MASRGHQARCPKRRKRCNACGESLSFANADAHQLSCPAAKVRCPGCRGVVTRGTLVDHIMCHCTARSFACGECGQAFFIAADFVAHAVPRCTQRVVACQLCGLGVAVSALAKHLVDCAERSMQTAAASKRVAAARASSSEGIGAWSVASSVTGEESLAPPQRRPFARREPAPVTMPPAYDRTRTRSPLRMSPGMLLQKVAASPSPVALHRSLTAPRQTSPSRSTTPPPTVLSRANTPPPPSRYASSASTARAKTPTPVRSSGIHVANRTLSTVRSTTPMSRQASVKQTAVDAHSTRMLKAELMAPASQLAAREARLSTLSEGIRRRAVADRRATRERHVRGDTSPPRSAEFTRMLNTNARLMRN
jgi:hypothetical protein